MLREKLLNQLNQNFEYSRIVALIGPRQQRPRAFADRTAFIAREQRRSLKQQLCNFVFQLAYVYGEGGDHTRVCEALERSLVDMEQACRTAYAIVRHHEFERQCGAHVHI